MNCKDCAECKHWKCARRNEGKDYPDCNCQHRGHSLVAPTKKTKSSGSPSNGNVRDDSRSDGEQSAAGFIEEILGAFFD